jgi:hypothetical protein
VIVAISLPAKRLVQGSRLRRHLMIFRLRTHSVQVYE